MREEIAHHTATAQPHPMPSEPERPNRVSRLTNKETQVVTLVSQGLTNKEAARELGGMSPHTVATHLRRAFVKLQVNSRDELAKALEPVA